MPKTIVNPIPLSKKTFFHESSTLRSFRDSDVVGKLWQKDRDVSQNAYAMSLVLERVLRELNRLRRRAGAEETAAPPSRDWFMGVWDSGTQYYAQQEVEYTPTGGQAGNYIALQTPPIGTAPDTGAPYWYARPVPIHSKWAF